MIEFLKEYNISSDTLKEVKKKYYKEIIFNIDNNEYEVRKILDYLKSLGIKDFNNLVLENLPILLSDYDYIYDTFSKLPNIKEVINNINKDSMYINEIIDY